VVKQRPTRNEQNNVMNVDENTARTRTPRTVENWSRVSSSTTISSCVTDNSLSTLKTFDNIDFQNDLIHLEAKIDVVGDTLHKQKNIRVT